MGALLKFIFYSIALTWLWNQVLRPVLFSQNAANSARFGQNGPQNQAPPSPPPPPEPKIEYRKFKDDEGEYVDYEELK